MEEKYQIKSEIEHILDRPGMYMGSTNNELVEQMLYQPSTDKIVLVKNSPHNAGLQKLFDEILSNSVDEHRRFDSLFHITEIHVSVLKNGTIKIRDNGGISCTKHKQTGIYIPELIFGHLRTSSNYDDTQERNVIGTNGLGSKLTNIFSTEFHVVTCDGKSMLDITWTNNMRDCHTLLGGATKQHFTEITFKIDLNRFDLEDLSVAVIRQMQKRCIDACSVNPKLRIYFESDIAEGKLNSEWQFEAYKEYIKLYLQPEQYESMITFNSQKFGVGLIPIGIGYNVAFVNGAMCNEGTHVKIIQKQIVDKLLDYCKKNEMELITEKDILNRMSLFINCSIRNPSYDSQTKERLTNKLNSYDLKIGEDFFVRLMDSSIIAAIKDFYVIKYVEEQKRENRKLNAIIKNTKNTKKLILCSSNGNNKELWLFEGNSASNGFRKFRNPLSQSAYLLRGKIKNTFDLKRSQITENIELREIIATLGLQFGEPTKNIKQLKYSKIIIDSDSDYDGHHICGLCLAFFAKHFPELIINHKIYRALSPIIICQHVKTGDKLYFYSMSEFIHNQPDSLNDYEVRYTKGLGGLADDDYAIMLRQQKLLQFSFENKEDLEYISIWFEKSSENRKILLLENEDYEETE